MTEHHHPHDSLLKMRARLAKVVASIEPLVRDHLAEVGTYEYTYTDINSILGKLKPLMAENGLALMQPLATMDGHVIVQTLVIDTETGDHLVFDGPGFPAKGDPQAAGSAITYYRRYALVSLFGLEQRDDDGAQARRDHEHRATGAARTEAEAQAVEIVKGLPTREERDAIKADFKEHFGCGLSELPESRHGEALGYIKWWANGKPGPDEASPANPGPEPDVDHETAYEGA